MKKYSRTECRYCPKTKEVVDVQQECERCKHYVIDSVRPPCRYYIEKPTLVGIQDYDVMYLEKIRRKLNDDV